MRLFNPIASLALVSSVLLCLGASGRAQSAAVAPKSDTQNWNDFQLSIPMSKKVDFVIQGTLRIGDHVTRPVDERWGFGFALKLGKFLSFNPFYFHREARPSGGKHESEDRFTLGATVRVPVGKFTLVERNWFERRERVPQVNAWRYRNRMQVEHPFKINQSKFTFFVSDEVFYDWSLHDWVRNRFGVGVSHAVNKHFTIDLYYLRQSDGRARPGDINVIGFTYRFRL